MFPISSHAMLRLSIKNKREFHGTLRIENNGIATVYLNRPDKRNAMSFALLKELVTTAKAIQKDRDIRCVILTGEAQVFSAGIDLSDLNNPKNSAFAIWELVKPGQSLFQKPSYLAKFARPCYCRS